MIEPPAQGWKKNIPNILTEVNQEWEVMFPMSRRPEILSWRLITYRRNCTIGRVLEETKCPCQAQDLI